MKSRRSALTDASLMGETPTILDHQAAARYVLSRRTPTGGYCFYRTPEWGVEEPNALDTLAALESLHLLSLAPPDPSVTGYWLQGLQQPDGGFPTRVRGWAVLRGLEALSVSPRRSPRAWLARWIDETGGQHRLERFDWRSSIHHLHWLVQLSTRGIPELIEDLRAVAVALLQVARHPSGGWATPGPDLETTALAMELCRWTGEENADEATKSFVLGCEHHVLGFNMTPYSVTTSVPTLWGGLTALKVLGITPSYEAAVRVTLSGMQRSDGGLSARPGGVSRLIDTWTGLRAEALLVTNLDATRCRAEH